jgi:hypothetical protein
MHPLNFEELAQQRISDLHRVAARQRLVPRPQPQKVKARRIRGRRLQRAPA